jgi:hypothetical protein
MYGILNHELLVVDEISEKIVLFEHEVQTHEQLHLHDLQIIEIIMEIDEIQIDDHQMVEQIEDETLMDDDLIEVIQITDEILTDEITILDHEQLTTTIL